MDNHKKKRRDLQKRCKTLRASILKSNDGVRKKSLATKFKKQCTTQKLEGALKKRLRKKTDDCDECINTDDPISLDSIPSEKQIRLFINKSCKCFDAENLAIYFNTITKAYNDEKKYDYNGELDVKYIDPLSRTPLTEDQVKRVFEVGKIDRLQLVDPIYDGKHDRAFFGYDTPETTELTDLDIESDVDLPENYFHTPETSELADPHTDSDNDFQTNHGAVYNSDSSDNDSFADF